VNHVPNTNFFNTTKTFFSRPLRNVLFCAWALLTCTQAYPQPVSPVKLADLLLDKGCKIVMDKERELWRDANSADYKTSGWKAWIEQTKSATPWRVTGDFNGDGVEDVAKIVIRRSDSVWMLGVEFGVKKDGRCERFQIAWNDGKPDARLPGLLALPKGKESLVCNHVAENSAAICAIAAGSLIGKRRTDAFIVTDDIPSRIEGYLWVPYKDFKKSDGSQMMFFDSEEISARADTKNIVAKIMREQSKPQPSDKVSPAQRVEIIAQFDAAFTNAEQRGFRMRVETIVRQTGAQYQSKSEIDFVPPNKTLATSIDESGSKSFTLMEGDRVWEKEGDDWVDVGIGAPMLTGIGAGIGDRGIVSVKVETVAGRSIKTIEVQDSTSGQGSDATLVIDENTKLPVMRIDRVKSIGSVTTSRYDFSTKPVVPSPTR
jgi:hypothetical protein